MLQAFNFRVICGCEHPSDLVGGSTETGTRTQDQLVKSQLLYQLSYLRFLYPLGRRGK